MFGISPILVGLQMVLSFLKAYQGYTPGILTLTSGISSLIISLVLEILLPGGQSASSTCFSLAHLQRGGGRRPLPTFPAPLAGEGCHVTVLAVRWRRIYDSLLRDGRGSTTALPILLAFLIPAFEGGLTLEIVTAIRDDEAASPTRRSQRIRCSRGERTNLGQR